MQLTSDSSRQEATVHETRDTLSPHRHTMVILSLLRQLQRLDPEFPLHYAVCFLYISTNEGCSLTSLAEHTGLSLSTISRIVGALSTHRANGQSYGLIEIRNSETERRRKELYLTGRGKSTLQKLDKILSAAYQSA